MQKSKGVLVIIDDEESLLETLKGLLDPLSAEVYTFSDPALGLDFLLRNKVNCVICDLNMPKMNGIEVIRKAREKGCEAPFVFFTAYGSKEYMHEALIYGAFDFIEKPHLNDLEDSINEALNFGLSIPQNGDKVYADLKNDFSKILSKLK